MATVRDMLWHQDVYGLVNIDLCRHLSSWNRHHHVAVAAIELEDDVRLHQLSMLLANPALLFAFASCTTAYQAASAPDNAFLAFADPHRPTKGIAPTLVTARRVAERQNFTKTVKSICCSRKARSMEFRRRLASAPSNSV